MQTLYSLLGALVNVGTVILGASIGLLLKKGIPERLQNVIMQAVALAVMFIGIKGFSDSNNTMVLILSMVIGTVVGTLLNLDGLINKLALKIENKFSKKGGFASGFVSSTLLFCTGGMTVVGALNSGLSLDHTVQFSKAVLDLITSTILASSMGYGVLFAFIPLFIYQGGITLLAGVLSPLLSQMIIGEMSAVGSVLIVALSLNMLKLTDIKVMNMIPAIFMPIILYQIPFFA